MEAMITVTKGGARMANTRDVEFRRYVELRRGDLLQTALFLAAGDHWGAEDLVQTALASLYVAWERVAPGAVDAYARRCLLNALIDHRRRAFTRRERAHADVPEMGVDDPQPIELHSAVFGALAQLSPRMRAAVVLRHLLDLSVQETADALNCRTGTVKSQTARGLEALRSALERDGIVLELASVATPSSHHPPGVRRTHDLPSNS